MTEEKVMTRKELLNDPDFHVGVLIALEDDNMHCPKCGATWLVWECCGLEAKEAERIAFEQYKTVCNRRKHD